MNLRKDVVLEGIPITWETNLSDSDLRELFVVLCHADNITDAKISNMGSSVFSIHFIQELVPFRDGSCFCSGIIDKITAIFRTADEWNKWETRQSEIQILKQRKEIKTKNQIQQFVLEDRKLKEKAKAALASGKYGKAIKCLSARVKLRKDHEHFQNRVPWMWDHHHRQDFINLLCSFPDPDPGLRLISDSYPIEQWFTSFAASWFFWRITYHEGDHSDNFLLMSCYVPQPMPRDECLRHMETIAEAGIRQLPADWMLHKDLCLLFERHGDYERALSICRRAVERGLRDNTKTGFAGMLKRLEGKIARLHNKRPYDNSPEVGEPKGGILDEAETELKFLKADWK